MPKSVARCRASSSVSVKEPGSSSMSIRSRAVRLPRSCCLATACCDPACTASDRRRSRSASLPAVVCGSACEAATAGFVMTIRLIGATEDHSPASCRGVMAMFKVPAAALACAIAVAACAADVAAPDRPPASPPAAAAATSQASPRSAVATVGASWPQRVILREDAALQDASQVLDPAAHVLYALVPRASGSSYVLQATDLRTGRVRRGASYRVSGLALAAGYLWVYGQAKAGRPSVLDETSPRTLATIRSLSVPGNDEPAPAAGPAGSVWAGAGRALLRVSVRTGAVLDRAVLPSGLELSGLAVSPGAT